MLPISVAYLVEKMRVLITGATGLVGTHLTKLLHEKGVAVNYLTTSKHKIEKDPNFTGYYWNPEKGEIDEESLNNVDAIVHLAGASIAQRWTGSNKREIIDSRIKSAELLLEKIQNSGAKIYQFITASGVGVYPSSLQKLYSEDDEETDNSFPAEVVIQWEAVADKFKSLGIPVAKIRTGLVLASEGGALQKMKEPASYNAGAAFGSGKQWQSWIHINDLAGIYFFVLQNELSGVYNAVAPNPVTNKELMTKIAEQLDKSIWLPNVPEIVLKLALGEMSSVVLSSQLVSSEKIQKAGYEFHYQNLRKALEDLL